MKGRAILGVVLFLAAFLSGCATTVSTVAPVAKVTHLGPETHRPAQVTAGGVMMQSQKGDHFTAYRLDDTVRHSFLGNSCTLPPQTFVKIKEDGEVYYAISAQDVVKPSPLNWQMKDYLSTCYCGIGFSAEDREVVSVVFEHQNGKIDKVGPGHVDGGTRAVLKAVPMVDLYNPRFLRKTMKFDSFADDFLTLRYMEERGQQSGYDARGNPVPVPPQATERLYEFDLQTSRTLNVQGARIEILEARPERLRYKVLQPLGLD